MSDIVIRIEKTINQLLDVPVLLAQGGLRKLALSFLSNGAPELFPEGTQIIFELFAPGDLVNPISPGGSLTLWARNESSEDYTASVDMSGPVLGALSVSMLFGRIRYTEPGQSEVVVEDFHINTGFSSNPSRLVDTVRWEQIENPPEILAGLVALGSNDSLNIGNLPGAENVLGIAATNVQPGRLSADQIASGDNAVAVGTGSRATDIGDTAIGAFADADGGLAIALGFGADAFGSGAITIGNQIDSIGSRAISFGDYIKNETPEVMELGYWQNFNKRSCGIRIAKSGNVCSTIKNSAIAPVDGGSDAGVESRDSLPRDMMMLRRNGDEILIDINVSGTIKTLSLGTAT